MHDIACDIIKTKINKVIQQGLNRIKPTKEQTILQTLNVEQIRVGERIFQPFTQTILYNTKRHNP